MTKLWAKTALTPQGWRSAVSVEIDASGRITNVLADQPWEGERCSILLPAPTNLHSHAFQRAMAGLSESQGKSAHNDFWSWRRLMYSFLDRLTPQDLEAVAALAQIEMLEAGFSSVAEFHYLHHGRGGVPYDNLAEMSSRIASAAARTGIGLTILPVLYQRGGCNGAALATGQDRFGCTRDQYGALLDATEAEIKQLPGDTVIGVAVHSLRAVSPESMAWAEKLRPDLPFHMHLAEQRAEVSEVESALSARPVTWVLDNFEVDRRWCLVHCTQMDALETLALARTGAVVGLCPITESNLGDGIFDGVRFLSAGGRFGIGSDSNVRISLVEELRTLEYSQRLHHRTRAALAIRYSSTGRALFDGACSGGALAAGRTGGSIEPDSWADLLELDGNRAQLRGLSGDTILDAWIFAGGEQLIKNVWSAGRHVVRGGRHVRREAIEGAVRPVLERLRKL